MKRKDFVYRLRKIADLVEMGDSAEGFIQWLLTENPEDVAVNARVRVGNLQGQGGMHVIEEAAEPDRRSIILDAESASVVTGFALGIQQAIEIVLALPGTVEIERQLRRLLSEHIRLVAASGIEPD